MLDGLRAHNLALLAQVAQQQARGWPPGDAQQQSRCALWAAWALALLVLEAPWRLAWRARVPQRELAAVYQRKLERDAAAVALKGKLDATQERLDALLRVRDPRAEQSTARAGCGRAALTIVARRALPLLVWRRRGRRPRAARRASRRAWRRCGGAARRWSRRWPGSARRGARRSTRCATPPLLLLLLASCCLPARCRTPSATCGRRFAPRLQAAELQEELRLTLHVMARQQQQQQHAALTAGKPQRPSAPPSQTQAAPLAPQQVETLAVELGGGDSAGSFHSVQQGEQAPAAHGTCSAAAGASRHRRRRLSVDNHVALGWRREVPGPSQPDAVDLSLQHSAPSVAAAPPPPGALQGGGAPGADAAPEPGNAVNDSHALDAPPQRAGQPGDGARRKTAAAGCAVVVLRKPALTAARKPGAHPPSPPRASAPAPAAHADGAPRPLPDAATAPSRHEEEEEEEEEDEEEEEEQGPGGAATPAASPPRAASVGRGKATLTSTGVQTSLSLEPTRQLSPAVQHVLDAATALAATRRSPLATSKQAARRALSPLLLQPHPPPDLGAGAASPGAAAEAVSTPGGGGIGAGEGSGRCAATLSTGKGKAPSRPPWRRLLSAPFSLSAGPARAAARGAASSPPRGRGGVRRAAADALLVGGINGAESECQERSEQAASAGSEGAGPLGGSPAPGAGSLGDRGAAPPGPLACLARAWAPLASDAAGLAASPTAAGSPLHPLLALLASYPSSPASPGGASQPQQQPQAPAASASSPPLADEEEEGERGSGEADAAAPGVSSVWHKNPLFHDGDGAAAPAAPATALPGDSARSESVPASKGPDSAAEGVAGAAAVQLPAAAEAGAALAPTAPAIRSHVSLAELGPGPLQQQPAATAADAAPLPTLQHTQPGAAPPQEEEVAPAPPAPPPGCHAAEPQPSPASGGRSASDGGASSAPAAAVQLRPSVGGGGTTTAGSTSVSLHRHLMEAQERLSSLSGILHKYAAATTAASGSSAAASAQPSQASLPTSTTTADTSFVSAVGGPDGSTRHTTKHDDLGPSDAPLLAPLEPPPQAPVPPAQEHVAAPAAVDKRRLAELLRLLPPPLQRRGGGARSGGVAAGAVGAHAQPWASWSGAGAVVAVEGGAQQRGVALHHPPASAAPPLADVVQAMILSPPAASVGAPPGLPAAQRQPAWLQGVVSSSAPAQTLEVAAAVPPSHALRLGGLRGTHQWMPVGPVGVASGPAAPQPRAATFGGARPRPVQPLQLSDVLRPVTKGPSSSWGGSSW